MVLWPLGALGLGLSTSTNGYTGQEPPTLNSGGDFSYAIPRNLAWLSPQLGHPISLNSLHFNDLHLNEMILNPFVFSSR